MILFLSQSGPHQTDALSFLPVIFSPHFYKNMMYYSFKPCFELNSHSLPFTSLVWYCEWGDTKVGHMPILGYLISHYEQYGFLKPVQFNQVCKCMAYIENIIMQKRVDGRSMTQVASLKKWCNNATYWEWAACNQLRVWDIPMHSGPHFLKQVLGFCILQLVATPSQFVFLRKCS